MKRVLVRIDREITLEELADKYGDNKRQFGALTTCLFAGVLITLTMISAILIFPQILDVIFKDARCKKIFLIMLPMLLTEV